MPALAIRQDLPAGELRRLARHEPHRCAAIRPLAVANALDGRSRAVAARLAGPRAVAAARCCADRASALPMLERQALRDAALRCNAKGQVGPHDRSRSGRPEGLTPGRQAVLKAWPLRRPDPERGKVSAGRLVDVRAHAERAQDMRCSGGGLSRLLQRLGRSRRKTRPGTDLAFAPALPEATFATVNLFSAGFARPLEPGAPAALVLDP